MSIGTRIMSAARKASIELTKPEGFVKGEEFLTFVRGRLFPNDLYECLHRTPDYAATRNDYIASAKDPDLQLRSRATGRIFWVEAKFRRDFRGEFVEWCSLGQFARYEETDKAAPVFIVIGMGADPGKPERVYFTPMRRLQYNCLHRSFLRKYEARTDRPIDNWQLARMLPLQNQEPDQPPAWKQRQNGLR